MDLEVSEWRQLYEQWAELRLELSGKMRLTSHLAQIALVDPEVSCQPGFRGCQAGLAQGAIGPAGEVYPCVLVPIAVGNIRNSSLARIWTEAPMLQGLRDRSLLGGKCGACPVRSKCGGCRAVAYSVAGSVFAEDPRCWLHLDETASAQACGAESD